MRLRVVVSEALRSLGASMSTTVAATLTVLIGMFVLGLTIALGTWVLSWSNHAKSQLLVKVYLCQSGQADCRGDATAKQAEQIRLMLARDARVERIKYISETDALADMRKRYPELVENLTYNPLPASFEVIPVKGEFTDDIRTDLLTAGAGGAKPVGIESVKDGGEKARGVVRVGGIIEAVFLVGLVVLLVASTLLIANTIRLSIFARRREIEVMKLVGATNWFVRGPFMIEGLLCGLIGSVGAIILLLVGKQIVLPALPNWESALVILAAGLLLGAVGSALTLHRFLRV
jgi:cell division transport system permease protein